MADLYFTTDAYFATLIPNTDEGEHVWRAVAAEFDGVAKFPLHMLPSIKSQIKEAGYTIRKAPRRTTVDDDALLAELGL